MSKLTCGTTCASCAGCDDRHELHEVFDQLDQHAPRYTSYPPANYLTHDIAESTWKEILQADLEPQSTSKLSKISLYVHIPFCESLCFFCACNRIVTKNKSIVGPYIAALKKQIIAYQQLLSQNIEISQLHFGGGTPNFLSPEELDDLLKFITDSLKLATDFSFSIELDPRTCSTEHLAILQKHNCQRVSIGVQDFSPVVQQAVNRIQPFELTKEFITQVRNHGVKSVGIDLIYGLPEQNRHSFQQTMHQVTELKPNRIAVYGYAHVPQHAPAQSKLKILNLPERHERLDLLLDAVRFFSAKGYHYLGLDHFVLDDDPLWDAYQNKSITRSFMGYNNEHEIPVLGIGVSAISIFPSALVQNHKDLASFQESIENNELGISKGLVLNETDHIVGNMIRDVLSIGSLNFLNYRESLSTAIIMEGSTKQLQEFQKLGLLEIDQTGFKLTFSGQIFARAIAKTFDYRTIASPASYGAALI